MTLEYEHLALFVCVVDGKDSEEQSYGASSWLAQGT